MWLWITAALILSFLPLINKKIEFSNYIWLLIPIDAYGISVAGATIKPYMIFAAFLPILFYCKNKGTGFELQTSKNQLLLGIISILIITVNLINCDNLSSVKAAFMTLVVYVCALFYTSCSDPKNAEQLNKIFIASAFGCGIIYIAGYLMFKIGSNMEGIVALTRQDDGMLLRLTNMVSGQQVIAYRLRGFAFDPNTLPIQFIFAISACVSGFFKKFNLYHLITLFISVTCIILSNSRMGILCCGLAVLITMIVKISQFKSNKQKTACILASLTSFAAMFLFFASHLGQRLLSNLLSIYSNRSSLTDEYGRFSIWKECLRIYWNKSPLLGVGFNNMSSYTETERMTHNTWLQFICEFGIIVGGIAVLYFIITLVIGFLKLKKYRNSNAYVVLLVGYMVIIISITSVDNITCSYLWFSALLLNHLMNHEPTQILE